MVPRRIDSRRHVRPTMRYLRYAAQGVRAAPGRQFSHRLALVEGGEPARSSDGHGRHPHGDGAPAPTRVSPHVAIYARVSSAENTRNLDSQAERFYAYCAARGYQVA